MIIKGQAKIELKDVKSGKKETYEHSNMFTNAAQQLLGIITNTLGASVANSYFLPLANKLLCGLYLFDNTLTENINNTVLPDASTAKLTGYAGNTTSDGNDIMRGDYNANESGAIENGYKFVWDFGTDDANGEIAAIALTNDVAGYHGYHYSPIDAFVKSNANSSNLPNNYKGLGCALQNPAGFDANISAYAVTLNVDTGEVLTIQKTSNTNITLRKYGIKLNTIGLTDKIGTLSLLNTENITIADTVQTEVNTEICYVDGDDGYFYGLSGSNNGSNYVLKISKINKNTKEYTQAVSYTLNNINMPRIATIAASFNSYRITPVIRNGYIYSFYGNDYSSATTNTYGIVKINLNNPSEYTKIANSEFSAPHAQYGTDWVIFKQNNAIITNGYLIDQNDTLYSTNIKTTTDQAYSYQGTGRVTTDGKQFLYGEYGNSQSVVRFMPNLQYLATINNLDTPVTKTAAKTMKITYTLTYAEE